jgi:arylsulfatase
VTELAEAWEVAAVANQVRPLDEGSWLMMIQRPPSDQAFHGPLTVYPGTPSLEHWRSVLLVQRRAWTVTVSLDYLAGDQGMLLSHGDQGGGYCLYIDDGQLVFMINEYGTMHTISGGTVAVATTTIRVEAYNLEAMSYGIRLHIDDLEVGSGQAFEHFVGIAPFQGIDVGIDRRSPVSWDVHQRHGNFAYTGTLHSAHWEPGEMAGPSGAALVDILKKIGEKYD